MANLTYEVITPSPMENGTVTKVFLDGVHGTYQVAPNAGYVLHDKARDYADIDPDTMEETPKLGYTTGYATCGANYAFTPVIVTDENGVAFTAYGSREFAARLATDVPADQIFGGNNDHEVM